MRRCISLLKTGLCALLPAGCILLLMSCGDSEMGGAVEVPEMETKADSVAMQVFEAFGGPEAWASLRYLRFDFGGGTESTRNIRASHLWDRHTGDYRVEMMGGQDTVYVALFNVNTREGDVYLNGEPVEGPRREELLEQAYVRFINDTYWLLMPVKMFDPGVTRTYVSDSSSAGTEVIQLSFADVGLTPGDRYWVYVDAATGRVDRWAFHLQSHPPDHVPVPIEWTAYKTLQVPAGEILVAERKVRDGFVTYTDNVEAPREVEDGAFTDPNPMLTGS